MSECQIVTYESEDFTMDLLKFGNGEKNMVILPGLSLRSVLLSAKEIEKAYSSFCEKYTVYLFDRRREIPDTYSVTDMAEDTFRAIRDLGLKDVYLYGVSQGGMMAQVIAINHGDNVKKLALCSTVSEYDATSEKMIGGWKDLARAGDCVSLNDNFFNSVYSDETLKNNKALFSVLKMQGSKEDCERFYRLADAIKGFSVTDRLKEINCETLVIGAKEDKVVSFKGIKLLASTLSGKFYAYEKFGHAVYDEAPDVKERIFDFFENK